MKEIVTIAMPYGRSVVEKVAVRGQRRSRMPPPPLRAQPLQQVPTVEEQRRQDARVAGVVHSLVSDCAECRIPDTEILREVLTTATDVDSSRVTADGQILAQRVFRCPVGIPMRNPPEKRGLAFAILVASCPVNALVKE